MNRIVLYIFVGLFLFIYYNINGNPKLNVLSFTLFDSVIGAVGYSLAIIESLRWIFNNLLWKIIPTKISRRYNISGKWTGKLYYEWNRKKVKDVNVLIKQSYSNTIVTVHTDEMTGTSAASFWDFDNGKLLYFYNTGPRREYKDANPVQDAAAKITIISDDKNKLRIEYWTDRQTIGYMDIYRSK